MTTRSNPSLLGAQALLLALSFLGAACGDEAQEAPAARSARAARTGQGSSAPAGASMDVILADLRAEMLERNPWFGERMANAARDEVAALEATTDDVVRFRTLVRCAELEGRLGNEREAIELRTRAYELLPGLEGRLPEAEATDAIFQLGVCYMRLGETQNCCLRGSPEACIAPIEGGGIHSDREGSTTAIERFTEVLARTSGEHHGARWLLNVAYMTLDGYPDEVPEAYLVPPETFESKESFPRFKNVAGRLGLDSFTGAGGVVLEDFDNDDDLDVFSCSWDPSSGGSQIFWNDGDGSFREGTVEAGLERMMGGLNAIQGDYDGDGFVDLLILRGAWFGRVGSHPNSLLRNNGDRTFTDVTLAAGLPAVGYPTQAGGFADFDNDGDLDLFVGNECRLPGVKAPNQLFSNQGDGTFRDVAHAAGVEGWGFTKGVTWGDYDGDGFADLYLSNRLGPNRLYHNNGDGTFTDVAEEAGVTEPTHGFPVWFWDYDNDGNLDICAHGRLDGDAGIRGHLARILGLPFKARGAYTRLYRGDGRGGFEDVARESGLGQFDFPMGANFGDLDGDGYLDAYIGTGFRSYDALFPNRMYRNVRGERFVDVTFAGGFGHLQKGHAIAFGDLDNDGDQDVFEQLGGGYRGDAYRDAVFENPGSGNHWLTVHLVGVESNRSAIGARVRCELVENGARRSVHRVVGFGGSFGANPLRQLLGLGDAERIALLEVDWPASGRKQRFEDVPLDRFLRVVEDRDEFVVLDCAAE